MKLIKISIEKNSNLGERNYSLFRIKNINNENYEIFGKKLRKKILTMTFRFLIQN
jgi:hypothetical protein